MKKQWKQLLFVVFSVFVLAACGIQSVEQHEKMEAEERSVEEVSESIQQESPEIKQEPATEVAEEKLVERVEEKAVLHEELQVEQEPKQEPEVKEQLKPKLKIEPEVKSEIEPKVEEPAPEVKQEPVKQAVEQPKEEPKEPQRVEKKRTVTIAIYVHSLVADMDKLHPSLKSEQYVPSNGVILKPVTYELLSEKDTVWDVLKRATKEHKIQLEYQGADENIYSSVYIEGINHIYEFSAGPLSGWMYEVNGTYPNYGASQYILADGDVIEWHYTTDLGRDLGEVRQGERS